MFMSIYVKHCWFFEHIHPAAVYSAHEPPHVLIESIKIVAYILLKQKSQVAREMSNNVKNKKTQQMEKNSRRFIRHCEK